MKDFFVRFCQPALPIVFACVLVTLAVYCLLSDTEDLTLRGKVSIKLLMDTTDRDVLEVTYTTRNTTYLVLRTNTGLALLDSYPIATSTVATAPDLPLPAEKP